MGDATGIEWTDATWNAVVGCEYASPGCLNCYAAREAAGRLRNVPVYVGLATRKPGEPARFTGEIRCLPERLDQPRRWARPRRVFVNSMSDLFHPDVPTAFIDQVVDVMAAANWHTYQVLTKRPARMAAYLKTMEIQGRSDSLSHVWWGTSIEDQKWAFRVDQLNRTAYLDRPTHGLIRFLSIEPLLGPITFLNLTDIDWVIVGGESGLGARPMHPDWVRRIRDMCQAQGVPFFFKQWGEWVPYEDDPSPPFLVSQHGDHLDGHHLPSTITDHEPVGEWWWPDPEDALYRRVGKRAAGRLLDGRTWDQYPS